MKPPKSILDPTFQYVDSANTSVAKTFARIRKEQRAVKLPGNRNIVALMPKAKSK